MIILDTDVDNGGIAKISYSLDEHLPADAGTQVQAFWRN
jgi:hypothetical protein